MFTRAFELFHSPGFRLQGEACGNSPGYGHLENEKNQLVDPLRCSANNMELPHMQFSYSYTTTDLHTYQTIPKKSPIHRLSVDRFNKK